MQKRRCVQTQITIVNTARTGIIGTLRCCVDNRQRVYDNPPVAFT
jgi:hypothetical protein